MLSSLRVLLKRPAWSFERVTTIVHTGPWRTHGYPGFSHADRCSGFGLKRRLHLSELTCAAMELLSESPPVFWGHCRTWLRWDVDAKVVIRMKGWQAAFSCEAYGSGAQDWRHHTFPPSVGTWLKLLRPPPRLVLGGVVSAMGKLLWNGSSLSFAAKPGGPVRPASRHPTARPTQLGLGRQQTSSGAASSHTSGLQQWKHTRQSLGGDGKTLQSSAISQRPTTNSRAHVRAERAKRFAVVKTVSYLKQRSVKPITVRRYTEACEKFDEWRTGTGKLVGTTRDDTLAAYLDVLFFKGEPVSAGRYATYALRFMQDWSVSKADFPNTHAALKGWRLAAPALARDPMPWQALLLLVHVLLEYVGPLTDVYKRAALVLPWHFDGYMRPSEALAVSKQDVFFTTHKDKRIAVIVQAAPDDAEGSATDVVNAGRGKERRKPAKSGHFDGTITLCDQASERAGRALLARTALVKLCASPACGRSLGSDGKTLPTSYSPLAGITLAQYEAALRYATKQAGLTSLKLTPHCARHGGASQDSQGEFRTLADIQQRGRWEAASSVARYKRSGTLERQLKKFSPAQLKLAASLQHSLPGTLSAVALQPQGPSDKGFGKSLRR
jgi:hypothetical protein